MKKLIAGLFARTMGLSSQSLPRRIVLLDVGARGGVQWPWNQLPHDALSVISVEPDPDEAAQLRAQFAASGGDGKVLSTALWRSDETLSLNLTRSPGASSVFTPARQMLEQFPEAQRFDIMRKIEVRARSIDGLAARGEMPAVDFAKIDTQGAELAILEGGVGRLSKDLVGLEVETEFARMYADQPLFADLDSFVRRNLGLELWDLRKTYWKYNEGADAAGPTKGRLIFGDALYLRSLDTLERWLQQMPRSEAGEKIVMLALTAYVYGYLDYATAVLNSPVATRLAEPHHLSALLGTVRACGNGFRPFRDGNSYIYFLLDGLARAFKPTHGGWASVDYHLGSRRRGPFWC